MEEVESNFQENLREKKKRRVTLLDYICLSTVHTGRHRGLAQLAASFSFFECE